MKKLDKQVEMLTVHLGEMQTRFSEWIKNFDKPEWQKAITSPEYKKEIANLTDDSISIRNFIVINQDINGTVCREFWLDDDFFKQTIEYINQCNDMLLQVLNLTGRYDYRFTFKELSNIEYQFQSVYLLIDCSKGYFEKRNLLETWEQEIDVAKSFCLELLEIIKLLNDTSA